MAGPAGRQTAWLLAVAAAVLVAASGLLTFLVIDGADTDESDPGHRFAQVAEAQLRGTAVDRAMTDERSRAGLELLGQADAVDTSHLATTAEARTATDRSIDQLRAWLDDTDADITAAYRPALDSLDDLATLRDEIDADPAEPSLANTDRVQQITDRYALMTRALSDAARAGMPLSTDDPGPRQGLALADAASRQTTTLTSLVQTLAVAGVTVMPPSGHLDESAEISSVSALYTEFTDNVAIIESVDRSPFREVVERSFPEQQTTELTTLVEAALAGETIDVHLVIAVVGPSMNESYSRLQREAEDEIQSYADRLASDNRSADRAQILRVMALGVTAALAVVAVVALIVTAATRRRPPPAPAPWPPPPPYGP
jgi:hypothetical protein